MPVLGSGLQRDWAEYAGADDLRERAPGRPPEPGGPTLGAAALADADVVIAPALAVDTTGARLGQGGGWYDRALEHIRPGVPVVALVFPEELYDAETRPLPRERHDRPVDAVATPPGWHLPHGVKRQPVPRVRLGRGRVNGHGNVSPRPTGRTGRRSARSPGGRTRR